MALRNGAPGMARIEKLWVNLAKGGAGSAYQRIFDEA